MAISSLKSVDALVAAYKNGSKHLQRGNHYMKRTARGVEFYYHQTAICSIEDGVVTYNYGGWHTQSTGRAINSYRAYFGAGRTIN